MSAPGDLASCAVPPGNLPVPRAGLHALEKANVLDRDHRLIGKGGHQRHVLVGQTAERLDEVRTITPIGALSRKSGTPSAVLISAPLLCLRNVYSGSARTSGMCTVRPSSAVRAAIVPRPGLIVCCFEYSIHSGISPLPKHNDKHRPPAEIQKSDQLGRAWRRT